MTNLQKLSARPILSQLLLKHMIHDFLLAVEHALENAQPWELSNSFDNDTEFVFTFDKILACTECACFITRNPKLDAELNSLSDIEIVAILLDREVKQSLLKSVKEEVRRPGPIRDRVWSPIDMKERRGLQ